MFDYFTEQFTEERVAAPRLGEALWPRPRFEEEDFTEATQMFECQIAHSARTVYNTLIGYAPQNRASALTSESIVCRYSEEFRNAGRKHYGLSDRDLTLFFSVHIVARPGTHRALGRIDCPHGQYDRAKSVCVRESAQ